MWSSVHSLLKTWPPLNRLTITLPTTLSGGVAQALTGARINQSNVCVPYWAGITVFFSPMKTPRAKSPSNEKLAVSWRRLASLVHKPRAETDANHCESRTHVNSSLIYQRTSSQRYVVCYLIISLLEKVVNASRDSKVLTPAAHWRSHAY